MTDTRVELALVPGFGPPPDLPKGECYASRIYEDGRVVGLEITRADPRVLISAELLASMFVEAAVGVELRMADKPRADAFWLGATIRIEAVNRTVVYRITEYVAAVNGYIGEWPD